jgi:hypothetical protein
MRWKTPLSKKEIIEELNNAYFIDFNAEESER